MQLITKDSFDRGNKPTQARYIRAHPTSGGMHFSAGLVAAMLLSEGDEVIFFMDGDKAYVSKLNTPEERSLSGWRMMRQGKHGLKFNDRYLVKKLLGFFGELSEGEKSMRIDILPEPEERKEQHGYLLYKMVRR